MAEKVIAIKIDVQGTAGQAKKLESLEKTLLGLTQARSKLNKQLKDGVITNDQYAKSIAKVNLGLKGTRRELLVTRQEMLGIDGFTTRLGKSFKKLGTQLSGAFVGLFAIQKLGTFISEGVETVKVFEKSLSELKAITGATNEDMVKFSEAARRLGRDTTKSAKQVAEAFTVVGSKRPELLKSADALIEVTESAILLSEAAGIEIPEAAQAITLALNQFGDAAGGAAVVTDTLAAAAKEGSVLIPQLAEELSKFGGIANNAGLSVQQSAAAVEVVGKTVEQSGTKLRNVLITLESGVDRFKPSVVGLETALDNLAKDGFDNTAALADKFGKQNAEGALSLIINRKEVTRLTEAVTVQGEALRQAQAQTDNFDGASKRLGSAIDELYLSIASTNDGEGGLKDITDTVATIINKFTTFLNKTNGLSVAMNFLSATTKLALLPFKALISTADAAISSFVAVGKVFSSIGDGFEAFKKASKDAFVTIKSEATELATETKDNVNSVSASLLASIKAAGKEVDVEGNRAKKADEERIKKISENREKARAKESKEQKKAREDKKKADEKLAQETLKNNQELLLLEIKDKQEAEDKKLEIERVNALKSIDLIKGSSEAKRLAIESVNAKFDAKEEALRLKRIEEEKAETAKEAEKKKEENEKKLEANDAFELQVKQQAINIAGDAANTLVGIAQSKADREKEIELANLNAQLENGLISQAEFEAQKLKIEKDAFNKKKKLELANVAIALATEIANIQAAAAANPLNAVTFGGAGLSQAAVLTGLAVAKSAIQAGAIASQSFAEGGFTGNGSGIADETGFKQAGIVHENEYVVPKHVLGTSEGSSLVGALEAMRTSKPMPNLNIGYANGGLVGSGGVDLQGLESRMTKAIANSLNSIQVTNVATETTTQAIKVSNIQAQAQFG